MKSWCYTTPTQQVAARTFHFVWQTIRSEEEEESQGGQKKKKKKKALNPYTPRREWHEAVRNLIWINPLHLIFAQGSELVNCVSAVVSQEALSWRY